MSTRRLSTRRFWAVGLLVTLLVAGVASHYASTHPDGLEYVAEQTGFMDAEQESATADSPFADYETRGVASDRLGVGLAGLTGVVLVLVLAGGLGYAVRRRTRAAPIGD